MDSASHVLGVMAFFYSDDVIEVGKAPAYDNEFCVLENSFSTSENIAKYEYIQMGDCLI